MYYPSSENKGADQLRGYREADLRLCFRLGKNTVFSRCGSIEDVIGRAIMTKNFHKLSFHYSRVEAERETNDLPKVFISPLHLNAPCRLSFILGSRIDFVGMYLHNSVYMRI